MVTEFELLSLAKQSILDVSRFNPYCRSQVSILLSGLLDIVLDIPRHGHLAFATSFPHLINSALHRSARHSELLLDIAI